METVAKKSNKSEKDVKSSLTKNQIAFQRGMIIDTQDPASKKKRLTIQSELMKLGYMLSKEALENVSVEWYQEVAPFIKKSLGIGNYKPFYPNFPEQVMEMSDSELFWNAIIHYWSNGSWKPEYELEKRGIKFERTTFKIIELGTEKEFKNIFTTLCGINQSITENDKNILKWFVENYGVKIASKLLPKKITFKETLCELAALNLELDIKSPTDVLRIAVYLSGGDISLPSVPKITQTVHSGRMHYFSNNRREAQIKERESFKFKNFTRSQRRYLLGLLEQTSLDAGEMKLKIGRWLRLGEKLHPGEYKHRFPKTFEAFNQLRNKADTIKTWYSEVNTAFEKSPVKGINFISQRPGEFARKMDWMLRNFDSSLVLSRFKEISKNVSRKVLWELYNHFLNRDTSTQRSIMLKGKKSKRKVLEPLPPMSKIIINKIQSQILSCIGEHLSELPKLGNVWIDPRLKNIPLPFAMRSVNTSIKTYIRGTRIPFDNPKAKVIRPYIHWNDKSGNEDLDLSVIFYNTNLQQVSHISYTNLKDDTLNSCHSGDIRHVRGRCAEYVDIDVKECLENKVRYAIVQVHNFQSRPMHTMDECVFGLMEREFPEYNKIFVPKTIQNAMGLSNESPTVCICILDLKNKEYIWADLELDSKSLSNLESTAGQSAQILLDLIKSDKLSAHDLFTLHGENRGKIVSDVKKAKTVFSYDDFVTSYDKIASYM